MWKTIDGYQNYQVSSDGEVRSVDHVDKMGRLRHGKVLVQFFDGKKHYLQVNLHNEHGQKTHQVHRLVADAFCKRNKGQTCVNHKDENKTNNRSENLEWCTHEYNCTYGSLTDSRKGHKNPQSKFSPDVIAFIKRNHKPNDKNYGTTALAKRFGMSISHVSAIANGSRWGWMSFE